MKHLARALLKLMTLGVPVVIACAYGPPVEYRSAAKGKAIDRETHQGIPGIQVTCVLADGAVHNSELSDSEGNFEVGYDLTCQTLRGEDVDAEANGLYRTAEIPFDEASQNISLLMDKEK